METKDLKCPNGTEEFLYKPWYGTKHMCLKWILFWTYWEGECPKTDDYDDALNLPALSPVIQAQFNGRRICGSRGGSPFLNVTRVESNGKCPKGTQACGMGVSAENTVCYPPQEHIQKCPITEIDVVTKDAAKDLEK